MLFFSSLCLDQLQSKLWVIWDGRGDLVAQGLPPLTANSKEHSIMGRLVKTKEWVFTNAAPVLQATGLALVFWHLCFSFLSLSLTVPSWPFPPAPFTATSPVIWRLLLLRADEWGIHYSSVICPVLQPDQPPGRWLEQISWGGTSDFLCNCQPRLISPSLCSNGRFCGSLGSLPFLRKSNIMIRLPFSSHTHACSVICYSFHQHD